MLGKTEYGIGDHPVVDTENGYHDKHGVFEDDSGAVPGESFAYGDSTYAKIQRFAGKYKIEQRGIERVPENERTDKNLHQIGTMVRKATSSGERVREG